MSGEHADLEKTLETTMKEQKALEEIAQALKVHPNTVFF